MTKSVQIGIIGDFKPGFPSHLATNQAIGHAAAALSITAQVRWVPTPALAADEGRAVLEQFDGLWASPGSPYKSMEGALAGIRFARERDLPFIGT